MERLIGILRAFTITTLCLVVLSLGILGCSVRKGGVLNIIPKGNQYEVTYQYNLPQPPPRGQVYVFWLVNVDDGKMVKMGTVQPGVNKTVRVQVDFMPTGAIVSPESDPNTLQPGTKWELMDGMVTR